ncbi:hypothetical protein PF003_g11207 [Phytophthora fragariae]|nr:hypothetical protein PF003_g11207 [Phytophthora fragariae]
MQARVVVTKKLPMSASNFDLVPSVDDDKVICGAPIVVTKPTTTSKTIQHAQADKVVDEWLEYTVDWVYSLRTRTDNLRAEMQVLLKHNKEIRHMELPVESNSA